VVCALVMGMYAYMAQSGPLELLSPNAAGTYYNLLVRGFRAGQLSLKKEAPPGLAQLADPYDPSANSRYRTAPYLTHDMSYYRGRLYLYFGVTPALILFWPFVALTGHWLLHRDAVAIFCATGFLTSVGLLHALWRRYFAEVSIGVVGACALALGLATGVPVLLSQSDVYEVPISCGYMLTMIALGAIWRGLHEPERSGWWLAAASAAYGLAVGARPNLLFGGLILLVPVMEAWRDRRRVWKLLIAATAPIMLIGLGLMLYNKLRFDSPLEFGGHYQLAGERQVAVRFFSLRYLWVNFRIYFLEPARWSARSPFVLGAAVPHLPAGYMQVRRPFGVLTNLPLVWLALAVPLTWRNRSDQAGSVLRWFVAAAALLFAMCALTLEFYGSSSFRYQVDFLPALLLLAVVGILGLERELANRTIWRRAARCGWGLLLGFSVAFNLLASLEYYAEAHNGLGDELFQAGKVSEAVGHYQQALRINPDYVDAHESLGNALVQLGRLPEAIVQYEEVLRINPDYVEAHCNLGVALLQVGRTPEAIGHWEQALRINPDQDETLDNLGAVLVRLGRVPEATAYYERALRINSDDAEARNALARLRQ
jgi:tetratricopeptide (TPR) repeat protein